MGGSYNADYLTPWIRFNDLMIIFVVKYVTVTNITPDSELTRGK